MKNTGHKIAFVGDIGVGKSSIAHRIARNEFKENIDSTIGAAFMSFSTKKKKEKINLWDTAGQERFFALLPMYTRDCTVILIVYDMSDEYSLNSVVQKWIPYLNSTVDPNETKIIMIGNKWDKALPQYKSAIVVPDLVDEYIAISAKSGHNCKKLRMRIEDIAETEETEETEKIAQVGSIQMSSNQEHRTTNCCFR